MMKKIFYTIAISLCAGAAVAQEVVPQIEVEPAQWIQDLKAKGIKRAMTLPVEAENVVVDEQEATIPYAQPATTNIARMGAPKATEENAGYLNPEGTLFTGINEKGQKAAPAVIGAFANDLDCWVWRNTATAGYKSVKYLTPLSDKYPSYVENELYFVDAQGNFCDSIMARGGWQDAYAMGDAGDAGYLWQQATPLQTVNYASGSKNFMLLTKSKLAGVSSCPIAAGGLPSGKTADGLWPLTNAVQASYEGDEVALIANQDENLVQYIVGSSPVVVEGDTIYPTKIITTYDKPQRKLYVKNITLAIGADGFSMLKPETHDTIKVGTLTLNVIGENGNVIATSTATSDNFSNLSVKPGRLLTFAFQNVTTYGEVLSEGFTVDEPFTVEIEGLTKDCHFGIYSAVSSVYESKTTTLYEDGEYRNLAYDPYIMLNGIYPTLESYQENRGGEVMRGDTIDIAFNKVNSSVYKYAASFEKFGGTGDSEFDFVATFAPYQTDTRRWNYEITRPDYIVMSCDYEYNLGDDEDPITVWDYMRVFMLHIYATDTPKLGDTIKMGKAGAYVVFKIVTVDGQRLGVNNVVNYQNVAKQIRNGQVVILRDGKAYNMLGQVVE